VTLHPSIYVANHGYFTDSLLFQFILGEFLESYELTQQLDILCNRKQTPLGSQQVMDREENLSQVEVILSKLVGSARDYMRLFSWNFTDGALQKLKMYCSLFLQHVDTDEKELIALQHYADKIWQSYLNALDTLREDPKDRHAFLANIDKASSAMNRFSKLISRLIHQFRDDENVIFFVLRNRVQFDKLYGNRFVARLFLKLYPKGFREIQLFLLKKYSERGFDNLLFTISSKMSELEASFS